jgi:hypothetical protein
MKRDTHIWLSAEASAALEKLKTKTDLSTNKVIERLLLGKSVGHLQFEKKR